MKQLLALVVVTSLCPAYAQTDDATQAVLDCTASNVPEKSFRQAAKMTVTDAEGASREMRATFAGMRGNKGMLLNVGIDAPQDVAGTSVLLRRDDEGKENIKIYLPALRRVRNVSGGMESQGIFGTDFSYRDLKDIFGAVRQGHVKLLDVDAEYVDVLYRLEILPEAAHSPYQRIVVDINKAHCVPQKLEFEAAGQGVVKTLVGNLESLHADAGRKMLLDYTMNDLLSGSSTHLAMGAPEIDERISRVAFNPASFYDYNNRIDKPE